MPDYLDCGDDYLSCSDDYLSCGDDGTCGYNPPVQEPRKDSWIQEIFHKIIVFFNRILSYFGL